jgi:hypothetical protein
MDEIWGYWKDMPYDEALATHATQAWRDEMLDEDIPIDEPEYALNDFRTEGTAKEMFVNYIVARGEFLDEIEVLAVEQSFAVPIDKSAEIFYVGRLDKVFKRKSRIYVAEHKTTSMYAESGNFRSTWVNSFSPNSQIDGYTYACNLLYPDFKAVWVDAALTHKQVHDAFMWIPLERSKQMMELWLWETNYWIKQIIKQLDWLDFYVQGDPQQVEKATHMHCFARSSPDSCVQYNRECIYKDLCTNWGNPEKYDCPDGFVVDRWEPFDEFKLEEIGLKK